ncbi:MAG: hypothetical protein E5Y52_02700 [Mesorhizobium sp.]|uniref:hypothetical protein n=1 Tax=Mesorhizobium sp. TaxID=1871066 RepID=UPI0012214EDB|nr:hypothetical protein [Mesorhizobium sp.]TIM70332.1 MAG: hypothetical protein E5Y52_02700 [Mesorhizobium sp.]
MTAAQNKGGGNESSGSEPLRDGFVLVIAFKPRIAGRGYWMRMLVRAAVSLFALTGSAFAYSDAQMTVMSHVGQAIAGTKICPKLKINQGAMALMLAAEDVKLDDPTVRAVIRSKVEETVRAWQGKSEDLACAAVLMLYGPSGRIAGLLRFRD